MPRSPALAPPPGNPKFSLADSMRGIAILLVILCHSAGFSGAFATASWGWLTLYLGLFGVAIFFGLSGFLLYRPYVSAHAGLRAAPQARDYARRRVLRIVPAYWAAVTLTAIWPGVTGPFSGDWWVYYGFGQIYSMRTIGNGIGIAWTVCVEVTFYALLPLIAALVALLLKRVRSRPWWVIEAAVLLPFAAVGPVARGFVQAGDLPTWAANSLLSLTHWFAAGMALAVASVACERRGAAGRARAWMWWTGAVAALGAAYTAFDIYHVDRHPTPHVAPGVAGINSLLFAVAATCALVPALFGRGGAIRRLLATRSLAYVGMVSYAMYLWHHPLLAWLANYRQGYGRVRYGVGIRSLVGGHEITLTLFVVGTALALLVGTVSYYVVELPFLRRKERRLFGRRRRVAAERAMVAAAEPDRLA